MPEDKIDPATKDAGNSKVADPAKDAGNSEDGKKKEEELDLEEMTYKQRYGHATTQFQKLQDEKNKKDVENAALREALGLGPDDPLPEKKKDGEEEDKGEKKPEVPAKPEDKKEEEEDDEGGEGQEKKPEVDTKVVDEKKPEVPATANYDSLVDDSERTALDLVWDMFAEKHPEVETDAELRQAVINEFPRFKKDALGNRVSLKKALLDSFAWVNRDKVVEKVKQESYQKGLLEASKNNNGALNPSPSKQTELNPKSTQKLSPKEQTVAAKMKLTEEEYLKWKNEDTKDDDDED